MKEDIPLSLKKVRESILMDLKQGGRFKDVETLNKFIQGMKLLEEVLPHHDYLAVLLALGGNKIR